MQTIGPFLDRSAIVGPNGVGKSNILDAIAFALNLNVGSLKSKGVRHLAHKHRAIAPSEAQAVQESAKDKEFFVKLNFLRFKPGADISEDSQGQ